MWILLSLFSQQTGDVVSIRLCWTRRLESKPRSQNCTDFYFNLLASTVRKYAACWRVGFGAEWPHICVQFCKKTCAKSVHPAHSRQLTESNHMSTVTANNMIINPASWNLKPLKGGRRRRQGVKILQQVKQFSHRYFNCYCMVDFIALIHFPCY